MNGKAIKFKNKSCTDCGERATIKVPESIANFNRLYYNFERLGCNYFKWWELFNVEYKLIARRWVSRKIKKRTILSVMKIKSRQ